MAPRTKTSREDVLAAALEVTRESGIEAVTARSVAAKIGCSIQPVFWTFETIDELKQAVFKRAYEIYDEQMFAALNSGKGLTEIGLAYVRFADTEKNLFKYMFMSNIFSQGSAAKLIGNTPGDEQAVSMISTNSGLDTSSALELFRNMWFMVHGIASLLATNSCTLSDDEARSIIKKTYEGLLLIFKNEERESQND